ncbi:MAG: GNAT family N-acetyltransferase [Rhizobiaceae bacterium]
MWKRGKTAAASGAGRMTSTGIALMRVDSPASAGAWHTIYQADREALPSQSHSWAAALQSFGNYRDASRLYEFSDGVRAIVPMFAGRIPSKHLAAQYSPPAAWGFGGTISTTPLASEHIHAIMRDIGALPAILTHIRPNPLHADLWNSAIPPGWTSVPRTAHVLDLGIGFETILSKKFHSDARYGIRRAEKAGLEVISGSDSALIADFHTLLRRSFERWAKRQGEPIALARWRGLRRDPEAKFLAMAASGTAFRIWLAKLDGKPIAAILVLRDKEAHYTRGAMIEEFARPTHANYLLHYRAIEDACAAGCSHYHMGETGNLASLAKFKSQFGAEPIQYAEYRRERLPIRRMDRAIRNAVKRVIGFRDD